MYLNLYGLIYFNLYGLMYLNLYGLIYFNLYGLIYSPKCTSDNFNLAVSKLLNICNCNLSSPAPQLCTGRRRRWWRGAGWWLWSPAHLSPSSSCSSPSGRTWCSSQWRGRSWTCWAGLYRRGTRGSAGGGRLTEYSRTQEPGTKYKCQEQLNENTVQHLSSKTFGGIWCYPAGVDIILTK